MPRSLERHPRRENIMLETTRRRGATVALYLIFGILIAVFVINFGPQSGGSRQGCTGGGAQLTVSIGDTSYGMPTWRWAFNTRGQGRTGQRTVAALDGLLRRELLAQEADARGLRVNDALIDEKIKEGEIWILTQKVDGKQIYFEDGEFFNYKMLERNLVGRFGLTIGGFKHEQRREVLAAMMGEILRSGGQASRDEARAQYDHAHDTVTIDAVAFPVEAYKAKEILTDADVDRWLAGHEAEAKARYEADKSTVYTGTPKKVRVRRVFVARTVDATPPPATPADGAAPPADGTTPADGAAGAPAADQPAPPPAKPDPARAKLEAARADIVAGKKSFADVAKALDADAAIAARGGDLGWLLPDAPGLGSQTLADALKPIVDTQGTPSPVVETDKGYYLLVVDGVREGDLTFDQVRAELGATLALDAYADEAARRAAVAALDEARAGTGKNLADMFEPATETPGPGVNPEQQLDLQQLLDDPNLGEDVKEQIRQMIQQQGRSGALIRESADVPASWQAQAGGASGAPMPVTEEPVAAKPAEPAAPPRDLMKASDEVLPKFEEVAKPMVSRLGPMPRDRKDVTGLGESPELIAALFELDDGNLADRIYQVKTRTGSAYVVAQVIKRERPDDAAFATQADDLVAQLAEERGEEIVTAWLKNRCEVLRETGKIRIQKDLLQERDDKGTVHQIPYDPCAGIQ
ncbi:MAG: SurA N-terminal domain-containing protein [Kofleriaceae bacterium]|nr:SurA N-terminal domain-containing protein [Kofleriaceae bacterium]